MIKCLASSSSSTSPVSLQEFISGRDWAGEEGRGGGGGDRGAVFRPGGKVAGALTA